MSPCWWIEASIEFLPKYVTSLWISRRICALCTAGSPPTKPLGRLASSLLPQGNIVAPVAGFMHAVQDGALQHRKRSLKWYLALFFWSILLRVRIMVIRLFKTNQSIRHWKWPRARHSCGRRMMVMSDQNYVMVTMGVSLLRIMLWWQSWR